MPNYGNQQGESVTYGVQMTPNVAVPTISGTPLTVQAMLNVFCRRLNDADMNLAAVMGADAKDNGTDQPEMNITQALSVLDAIIGNVEVRARGIRSQVGVL